MHIIYIHQHFATSKGSTGTRSYEFARRWVKAGHEVTVITGYYDIGGLEPGRGLIRQQNIDGINVVVVGTMYSNKQSYVRRIVSFLLFLLFGSYAGLRVGKADVIYATSTPLTVGILAIFLKWLKRIPFVFEVRDQWPEIPIEMGIIKNRVFKTILLWLERTTYKQSTGIVALSPGMAEGIKAVLKKEIPISVIPNSCDLDVFKPPVDCSKIRQKNGWNDKMVFLYVGAMGRANGVDFVINAAERFKDKDDIHFVLIGEGKEKPSLIKKVEETGLRNVEIRDAVSKAELPELLVACDVSVVVFAKYPILENNSANKFFDSLSAGKPVLLNYSGWQRVILERNEAGFGCALCDVEEFVEKILYLREHRKRLPELGKKARQIAVENFDRDKLSAQVLSLLKGQCY
ncbi:MAG: glycosyltransferase family 4 protein [Planctomycetota bacterium]|jgi:glycosyltransferase involved in cell wall biosynthesis